MGVFDFIKSGVREMMIARPDAQKKLIVYKHPDQNVPVYSQLTVDSDECVVFFKDGVAHGVLPPGRHVLHTQNIPFLNQFIQKFTGGNVFIAEVFFVKTAPVRGVSFGGPIGDMIDPLTGEQVCPRIFGEFSLVVSDPMRFIVAYAGQAAAGDNDAILSWVKGLFLNGVKATLGELCEVENKSVLQAVSLTQKLAQSFIAKAPDLDEIGVRILQMGSFQLNFSEGDRSRLVAANAEVAKANRGVKVAQAQAQAKQFELDQKYQQDSRYVKELAGNYQNYAAGQVMMGAAEGMVKHGLEGGGGLAAMGVQMGVGVNMANMMTNSLVNQAQFESSGGDKSECSRASEKLAPSAQISVQCTNCSTRQISGAKFCAYCGTAMSASPKLCLSCGAELLTAAKFCAHCGTAVHK